MGMTSARYADQRQPQANLCARRAFHLCVQVGEFVEAKCSLCAAPARWSSCGELVVVNRVGRPPMPCGERWATLTYKRCRSGPAPIAPLSRNSARSRSFLRVIALIDLEADRWRFVPRACGGGAVSHRMQSRQSRAQSIVLAFVAIRHSRHVRLCTFVSSSRSSRTEIVMSNSA